MDDLTQQDYQDGQILFHAYYSNARWEGLSDLGQQQWARAAKALRAHIEATR